MRLRTRAKVMSILSPNVLCAGTHGFNAEKTETPSHETHSLVLQDGGVSAHQNLLRVV